MFADLIRAFIEAVAVRGLGVQLPPGAQVTELRIYPHGFWSIDWSQP